MTCTGISLVKNYDVTGMVARTNYMFYCWYAFELSEISCNCLVITLLSIIITLLQIQLSTIITLLQIQHILVYLSIQNPLLILNPHSLSSACRRWMEHNRNSRETISSTTSLPLSFSIKTNPPTTSPS